MERDIGTDSEFMIGGTSVKLGRFSYGLDTQRILQWNEGASLKIGSFCSIAKEVTFMMGGNHRADWITTYPFGRHIFADRLGGKEISGHPSSNGDIALGSDV